MSEQSKYLLDEDRIPQAWYNIVADLPSPPPRFYTQERVSRSARTISAPSFRWGLSPRSERRTAR